MDAARVKPARSTNPPSEVDRLSSLPDCLILQIFLNLPTKDVVQTSALSTRWTTLWKDVRVHSKSLLTFMHDAGYHEDYDEEDRFVEIDAPMLKYLRISDDRTSSFIIKSPPSVVEADIDTVFNLTSERSLGIANEVQKRAMVRDFLLGISKVKDMSISSSALEVIYDYSRYVQLPVFRNLYTLRVRFDSYMWEMLPVFLEVFANLKTLVVGTSENPKMVNLIVIARPWSLLSSLEYVDIERPLSGEALEMTLVGYLLENSPNLKKLSLSFHDSLKKGESVHKLTLSLSDIFIELNFPRLSSSCQIIVR
ncbi:PREDICTED: F-box/LRR-repeat protein 13-like [Brassica oleracea var. oleracea]|nr:PREDICTED: F-box/LRR-repeat protein 13-like [Brassica oleracea var. oleracea]